MTSAFDWAARRGACDEALYWLDGTGFSLTKAWQVCPQGDWMAWALRKAAPTDDTTLRKLVLWACDCAARVQREDGDPRSWYCIETARRWAFGRATLEEVREAARDAWKAVYSGEWPIGTVATWTADSAAWTGDVGSPVGLTLAAALAVKTLDKKHQEAEHKWQADRLRKYIPEWPGGEA